MERHRINAEILEAERQILELGSALQIHNDEEDYAELLFEMDCAAGYLASLRAMKTQRHLHIVRPLRLVQ